MTPQLPVSADLLAALEVHLGIGAEGLALEVSRDGLPEDLDPWLGDLRAVRLDELGHWDRVPRTHDWEHVLPLLQREDELLWIVEYWRDAARPFTVRLALKSNQSVLPTREALRNRETRFDAVVSQLRRQAFPESALTEVPPDELWSLISGETLGETWCVSGVPSPKEIEVEARAEDRTGERPSFQSLNDVVESFLHVPYLRLVFVVGRVRDEVLAEEFGRVARLRNHVHPLVKAQVAQAEQVALSWQRQEARGEMEGATRTEADNIVQRVGRGLATLLMGSRPEGRWASFTWDQAPASRNDARTTQHSTGESGQISSGRTQTLEQLDSALELIDQSLGRYADNLYAARASGGWRAACFVQAGAAHAPIIANALRGVLSGAQSRDRPLTAFPVRGAASALFRANRPILEALAPAAPVLTDVQACRMLMLPEAELPGLRLHRSIFLGRNAAPEASRADASRVGLGPFGFAAGPDSRRQVEVDVDDLFRHVLVCGTTGSGKTRRVLSILNGLAGQGDDLRVIVFETAKRTYRDELRRLGAASPRIYTLGESTVTPLRINPFYFEPGTSLKRHISVLSDALSELMPTEALIGPKMREAVERVYLETGWDIETARWRGGGAARYPSPIAFVHAVRRVAAALTYGKEVSANYRGALEGRARVFLDASFQDIFNHGGEQDLETLFDRDTILELEGLPSSEIDLPAFLLSLLLERLRSHQQVHRRRRWLLVVEEAHNVLPRSAEERRSGSEADGAHTLVRNLVRLLQEGREMGIGVMVVDQAPSMLARGVLKNTNTKIVMRLEDGEEINEMGQGLGLEPRVWPDLGVLRTGEAVIKASYMSQPVKSAPYAEEALPSKNEPMRLAAPSVPAYAALEDVWATALRGDGRAPDQEWLTEALALAGGAPEALRFGLGLALLRPWTGAVEARATALLDRFDALPAAPEPLLERARSVWARARAERSGKDLGPLEARLLAVICDLPLPSGRPGVEAVGVAAEILSAGPERPPREEWERALGALLLARPHRIEASTAKLRALSASDGLLGAVIRLEAARQQLLDLPGARAARATPFHPLLVVERVSAEVERTLTPPGNVPGDVLDRLIAGVARVLVHQVDPALVARLPLEV